MSFQSNAGMMTCLAVFVASGAVHESPEHASTVPITRVGNAIFVQAKIAEQTPVNLLVDSAASATLILDRTLANHMRLPAKGAQNLKGAGKDECPADRLAATRIIVGDKTLSVSTPFATDLSHITRFLKRRTGGAIGGNLFRGHVVTLDFARNLLTISSARLDSPDQESMPMFSLGDCAAPSRPIWK